MPEQTEFEVAIEACRPGSGDWDEPEMEGVRAAVASDAALAHRYEAIQQFDGRVGEAIRQGDVPPGLEDRILTALAAADGASLETRPSALHPLGNPSRRRLWTVVAIAATAAAIATGLSLWQFLLDDERLARTDIEEQAAGWCDGLDPEKWRQDLAPTAYPFATEVLASPDAWQSVSLPDAAGEAVAYRLAPPFGVRRMTLLVLKGNVTGVPHLPPPDPYKTQDRLVAAWQVGAHVFVLVIQGDDLAMLQETYDRNVRTSFPSV